MSESRTIRLRRIKSGSLLRLIFIAAGATVIPLFVLFGVLALFGAETVSFNGRHITGPAGLLAALLMAPFFTLFIAVLAWIGAYLGIRVIGGWKPLALEYVPADNESSPPPPSDTAAG